MKSLPSPCTKLNDIAGPFEGETRRITARAADVQLGEQSTVTLPNADFTAKTARQVAHANPLGLVRTKLPVPLGIHTRALLLAVVEAKAAIVKTPVSNLQPSGLDHGNLIFNAAAYVSSPCVAYGVRRTRLIKALSQQAEAGIDLSKPLQTVAVPAAKAPPILASNLPNALVWPLSPAAPVAAVVPLRTSSARPMSAGQPA